MSLKTFLEKAGEEALKVITFGAVAAQDAAPFVAIGNPALGALLSSASTAVITAEAAGTSAVSGAPATANGAQKAALAISAIEPDALAFAKSIGAPTPTQDDLQQVVNLMVSLLQVFKVPTIAAAAVSSTTPTAVSSTTPTAVPVTVQA